MKKFLALILSLTLVFALASCSIKTKGPDDASSSEPVTSSSEPSSEPETSSSAPEKSDLEVFMDEFGGVWIDKESLDLMYEEEYTFTFYSLSLEAYGSGVYPGGGDRPAKITGVKKDQNGVYVLSLFYEAGDFMGEELPEERVEMTVLRTSDTTALFGYGDNLAYELHYGGKDLDEAKANAKNIAAK